MNTRSTLSFLSITAFLLFSGFALAATPINTKAKDPVQKNGHVYGSELMTQTEKSEMRLQIRLANTTEERDLIRKDNHQRMIERANKQGLTLADEKLKKPANKDAVTPEETLDKREALILNQAQQMHVLTEMRSLLAGTQAIVAALAADDMALVAKQAKLMGMEMKKKPENDLQSVLPEAFMVQGKSVHLAFDSIAESAIRIKNSKNTLHQLSETLKICQGCHETYRIELTSN